MEEYYHSQIQNSNNLHNRIESIARDQMPSMDPNIAIHNHSMPHMSHPQINPNYQIPHMAHMPHIPHIPHILQMSQMAHPADEMSLASPMSQINPQMMDQRLITLEQENLLRPDLHISHSNMNEGYLSPASAIAQGWTPQVVYVPSPMIHMIPSPMQSSMIPSPLLPPIRHITAQEMATFNHGNAGLGLLNPEVNPENQEFVQSSFEDMLSSLGLLPNNNNDLQGMDPHFQKWTALKGKDRTLYKCPWEGCEKTFTRPYNLKSHYRGHTGERPFVCNVCNTGFARKHDLKRHVKIHDGLKSFSCPFCHKCFTRSDALRRHLKNDRSGKETSCSLKQARITQEEAASSSNA